MHRPTLSRTLGLSLSAALVAGLFLAGPASAQSAADVEPLPDSSRLVVIGGSLTEIVYALGEEGRLIARDSTATYPEAAAELPDVGYMRALSPEGVLSANPSALLILEGSGPPEALEVLTRASVPIATIPEQFTHQGIVDKVKLVGRALGVEPKADALAAEIDARLSAAEALTADIPERKRVLFILSMQAGKVMASGTNTAANGIIELAGAENAVTDYEGYKTLTDEAVIEARPDVILMMDRSGDHAADNAQLLANPAIAMTPAAANQQVLRFDGAYLLGFGPRTAEAVEELSKALYGESAGAHD